MKGNYEMDWNNGRVVCLCAPTFTPPVLPILQSGRTEQKHLKCKNKPQPNFKFDWTEMNIYAMKLFLMAICFVSCGNNNNICNPREAKRIMENFAREYTGLDTLIRINGYYYNEDSTRLISPFMVSNNGEFRVLHVRYENHIQIQEKFRNNSPTARGRGSYTLSGDTIKVRWAEPFQIGCYIIFSQQYVIIDDTTLKRIWHLCETCETNDGKNRDPKRNEIYKFFKFQIDM